MTDNPTAIIADDEEQLRDFIKRRIAVAWPELNIVGEAKNGLEAVELIETYTPDVAFLDIHMPGLSGLEVAKRSKGNCRIVFVTSYDHYAVEAFDREAIDYLLKPVTVERLAKTVDRLKKRLQKTEHTPEEFTNLMASLLDRLPDSKKETYLKWVKVQHGESVRLISVDDIFCFKSSDKYTVVYSTFGESLISTPIKALTSELDPDKFWQIHRSTIVSVANISKVSRSLTGRHVVKLKNVDELFTASRTYSSLFKQM